MAVQFRFATIDDAEELAEVHTRSWQTAYRGLIDQAFLDAIDPRDRAEVYRAALSAPEPTPRVWVVAEEVDDSGAPIRLLGHTESHVDAADETRGILQILYLEPETFGTGLGKQLHDMSLRGLHRFGVRTAALSVLQGNQRAIAFYERQGWHSTGEIDDEDWSGVTVPAVQMEIELSVDLLAANEEYWTGQAPWYAERQTWSPEVDWGVHGVLDADAGGIFPEVAGLDVVEIGCGTAYVSNWARLGGARNVIALDYTPAQLATAQERARTHQVDLPLVRADGHRLPFADDSFDLAINEYGAAIWCDPRIWIPEAARVLRPGGRIWFLGNSVAFMLCAPEFEGQVAQPAFVRPQRGMHRMEWIDTPNVEFHVSHGEMISILTGAGFVIEALHELYAPEEAEASAYGFSDGAWASQWPVEEVWVARLPEQ
ncbi:MAG: bifunctional GNAT family N-acetyltransferase/class I SAM-dependent methyltransferase [Actinomycetota bacterium]